MTKDPIAVQAASGSWFIRIDAVSPQGKRMHFDVAENQLGTANSMQMRVRLEAAAQAVIDEWAAAGLAGEMDAQYLKDAAMKKYHKA